MSGTTRCLYVCVCVCEDADLQHVLACMLVYVCVSGFLLRCAAGSPSEGKIPFSRRSSILHEPIPRRHCSACPPDSQAEAQAQARLLTDLKGGGGGGGGGEGVGRGGQRWRMEEEGGRVNPGRQEEAVDEEGGGVVLGIMGLCVCMCLCVCVGVCA